MNAIVSGRSGCAVLFENEEITSIHVDEPDRLVRRTHGDLLHLLGEASDLRFLEHVDRETVRAELETASAREEALSLFLILLDGEQSESLRSEAARALEELLTGEDEETPHFAAEAAAAHLANVLYARPLPPSADPLTAREICREGRIEFLGRFLQEIVVAQPVIRDVERAWESIPLAAFGGTHAERSRQHGLAVRSGCFLAAASAVAHSGRLELPADVGAELSPDVPAGWSAAYELVCSLREPDGGSAADADGLPQDALALRRQDLERLIQRPGGGTPVLSLFLDMSVDSNHRRNYHAFLGQQRARLEALDGNAPIHAGSGGGSGGAILFERVLDWIDSDFDESNRGLVIYAEAGGGWWEALQFPVPVQNRLVVADRPVIGPLAQVLNGYEHYGVLLLDREQVRILSVYLGTLLDELGFRGDPAASTTHHHLQAGGYSHTRFQRRKAEEMRHFFRDVAVEVERFVARYHPRHLVLLGTEENIGRFRDFLPQPVQNRVVYAGPATVDGPAPEILARLAPHLAGEHERESQALLEQVRERVAHDYLATAGVQGTLTALQEGKVDTLVLASDGQMQGTRCTQCGFVFVRDIQRCPYDGSEQLEPVDVQEEMVRLAQQQGAHVEFAEARAIAELRGSAALLRY